MSTRVSPLHAGDGSMDPNRSALAIETIRQSYHRPDDATYAAILPCMVRNCVDTIVLNERFEALMGLRVNEPWKGHWHPSGGGQIPGDSYEETASLHMKRDLELAISPERFQFVNSAPFLWSTSAQGVPCHMNGVLMVGKLTQEELENRTIPAGGDFKESRFFPLSEVTTEAGFHPAIVLGVKMISFNLETFGRLGTIDPTFLV